MTKAELIDKIASGTGLSKADASRALDSTLNSVKISVKERTEGYARRFWNLLSCEKKIQKRPQPENRPGYYHSCSQDTEIHRWQITEGCSKIIPSYDKKGAPHVAPFFLSRA